jgi:hypothetical protein
MRPLAWMALATIAVTACSGGSGSNGAADAGVDAASPDGGSEIPDVPFIPDDDATTRDALGDVGPYPCDPLSPRDGGETVPAAVTGRIVVTDTDTWDTALNQRFRARAASILFRTRTLPVFPITDGPLYPSIGPDRCVAFDWMNAQVMTGAERNIGTTLLVTDNATITIALSRVQGSDGPEYKTATTDTRLYRANAFNFAKRWTWLTPGDVAEDIRPAKADIDPVEPFEVMPAFTSTSAPVEMTMTGTTIRWTPPSTTRGEMTIVLGRALGMGQAHYLICHPVDDGAFTLGATDMAAFAPAPGLAFDLVVQRAQRSPFCNEGVTSGVAMHTLIFAGRGLVR